MLINDGGEVVGAGVVLPRGRCYRYPLSATFLTVLLPFFVDDALGSRNVCRYGLELLLAGEPTLLNRRFLG